MLDCHQRRIDYLRISITDRCNFRCKYCMPPEGVKPLSHNDILTYEEILRIVKVVAGHGIKKIRITGGEPLVRKGVTGFIQKLSCMPQLTDISMTTNGSLLAEMAVKLKSAGLKRVNISLDTVDFCRFTAITGKSMLNSTLKGIESAFSAGLSPVKLNVVLMSDVRQADIKYFIDLVYKKNVAVRFIECMPLGGMQLSDGLSTELVKTMIESIGKEKLEPAERPEGNGPARYYRFPGTKGLFGFISPLTEHFCGTCNRMRLTADGRLKPCLLSENEIDLKGPVRSGATDSEIAGLFLQAIAVKPSGHTVSPCGNGRRLSRGMSQIGG